MSSTVEVQYQEKSGHWRTVRAGVQNNPQVIKMRMDEVARLSPTGRVRAVTRDGRIVDIR